MEVHHYLWYISKAQSRYCFRNKKWSSESGISGCRTWSLAVCIHYVCIPRKAMTSTLQFFGSFERSDYSASRRVFFSLAKPWVLLNHIRKWTFSLVYIMYGALGFDGPVTCPANMACYKLFSSFIQKSSSKIEVQANINDELYHKVFPCPQKWQ